MFNSMLPHASDLQHLFPLAEGLQKRIELLLAEAKQAQKRSQELRGAAPRCTVVTRLA
jgi:hypothetical protein